MHLTHVLAPYCPSNRVLSCDQRGSTADERPAATAFGPGGYFRVRCLPRGPKVWARSTNGTNGTGRDCYACRSEGGISFRYTWVNWVARSASTSDRWPSSFVPRTPQRAPFATASLSPVWARHICPASLHRQTVLGAIWLFLFGFLSGRLLSDAGLLACSVFQLSELRNLARRIQTVTDP
jgi:hypothetical protein